MTQAHDMPIPTRRALQLDVTVPAAPRLLDGYDPPHGSWDLGDCLIDRVATICRDTEWSPDAFGAYSHGERMIVEAYGDDDPSEMDQQLVLDALEELGVDVHSHSVIDALDS